MAPMRAAVILALGIACSTQTLHGQDKARYREFQLGANLASVATIGSASASDAKTIHERPVLMQELEWRPPYAASSSAAPRDPVRQIVFSFYDDQLSQMVVDYDHDRTFGMTNADMLEAISATYGTPLAPQAAARKDGSAVARESGAVIARWGDASYSVVLYRVASLYGSAASQFRLVVASPRLTALAATADAQAIQMDVREAPQRAIAQQKQDADDSRAAEEKARTANKAAFRP